MFLSDAADMKINEIKETVIGQWPSIYQALGIDVGHGKHGPCPLCGGKDRFLMDDKEGRGTYFCNQCGAGDGWKLVQGVLGCDFKSAIDQVAPLLGKVQPYKPKEPSITPEILREIFVNSEPASKDNLVGLYLSYRGLKIVPSCLRYAKQCWDGETRKNHPAMLAVVTLPSGRAVTMHRTYLDVVTTGKAKMESPKKVMPGLEKMTGGAIRLFEPDNGTIGIAEGIETAIACTEMFNLPVWSVISATMMEAFEPPKGIKTVHIFGDNDANFAGQKSAFVLANKLALKKYTVEVRTPSTIGDYLDELNFKK